MAHFGSKKDCPICGAEFGYYCDCSFKRPGDKVKTPKSARRSTRKSKGRGKIPKPGTKRELNRREGPVWKTVTEKKPFCPECGSEMKHAKGDVATMFRWQCSSFMCHYVC